MSASRTLLKRLITRLPGLEALKLRLAQKLAERIHPTNRSGNNASVR